MRHLLPLAVLLLAGCAATTDEVTALDPVEVTPITGTPEAVAHCIAGEHVARGLRIPTTRVDVLRRADAWVVQLSGCTVIGCSLGQFPGAALVLTPGRLEAHRLTLAKWHAEFPAVVEDCATAT